jgi:hypothetical protein
MFGSSSTPDKVKESSTADALTAYSMVLTNNNIGVGNIVVANVHSAAATAAAAANQFVKKKSAGAPVQSSGRIRPAALGAASRARNREKNG